MVGSVSDDENEIDKIGWNHENTGNKQRTKERKISYVIERVSMW